MNSYSKLARTVAAIIGGSAVGFSHSTPAADAEAGVSDQIEEVVVTAERRSENLQKVPITIQAITADTLDKLNVETFDDLAKYLPNVTTQNLSPGQGNIYLRGLAVGTLATQGQGSVGFFPTVAVYLDDQSTSLPNRNLDVYAADLERVEVLEGPQGTLFGAGAEAGVVRYITNKPKLDVTEGSVTGAYSTTAHGDPNSNLTAVINLPLITDTLAFRAVVYQDARGGYISNVPATLSRSASNQSVAKYIPDDVVPTDSETIDNYSIAKSNQNTVVYQGLRASALYKINEDWNALLSQTFQSIDAEGVFYQQPYGSDGTALAPLQATAFTPSYDKDKFSNTAWTLNGKFDKLNFVYTGAYLTRHHDAAQDYTNYSINAPNSVYYQCVGYSNYKNNLPAGSGKCYSPAAQATDNERNTVDSQEIRLSTPDDWRIRGLVGAFYQDQVVQDFTQWHYRSVPTCTQSAPSNCFLPIEPWPGSPFDSGQVLQPGVGFIDDFQRELKQAAGFASMDVEIVPKTLTLTLGTRYFNIKNTETGGDVGSFYCKAGGLYGFNIAGYTAAAGAPATTTSFTPCAEPYGTNVSAQTPHTNSASGFKSRANITWNITDDAMTYFTWSQGYRPGGFNRGVSCHGSQVLNGVTYNKVWCNSNEYASDSLINYEVGWKTEWLNRRVQFDGSIYREIWNDVQTGIFSPTYLGNLTLGFNGPNYKVDGAELQLTAHVYEGLAVIAAASWNSSSLTNSPFLIINNPALKGGAGAGLLGQPLTGLPDPYGIPGSETASSPPFQGNIRVRDDFTVSGYNAFWQVGMQHSAHSWSSATALNLHNQPEWTTFDASVGFAKGSWNLEAFGTNLSDQNKSLFSSTTQFVLQEVPIRPRVLGLRLAYKFKD